MYFLFYFILFEINSIFGLLSEKNGKPPLTVTKTKIP